MFWLYNLVNMVSFLKTENPADTPKKNKRPLVNDLCA